MRKIHLSISAIALVLIFGACKKSNSTTTSDAKTVDNLSGTYLFTAINVTTGGVSFDEFASLKDCEKDNTITLHTDLTVDYTDAGTQCAHHRNLQPEPGNFLPIPIPFISAGYRLSLTVWVPLFRPGMVRHWWLTEQIPSAAISLLRQLH